jgi:hypothetical protein
LFERCVPVVRFTVAIAVYIQTPGTILSLSWPFDADDSCESAHDDKQQPYGRLLVARSYERLYLLFIPWSREGAADAAITGPFATIVSLALEATIAAAAVIATAKAKNIHRTVSIWGLRFGSRASCKSDISDLVPATHPMHQHDSPTGRHTLPFWAAFYDEYRQAAKAVARGHFAALP